MKSLQRALATSLIVISLSLPLTANATLVFGGKVTAFLPCFFTGAIWVTVGAPRGGLYIWSPSTRTYPNGPPGPGRWTLGLYSAPYFCVWLIAPLQVAPGMLMTMEASSH